MPCMPSPIVWRIGRITVYPHRIAKYRGRTLPILRDTQMVVSPGGGVPGGGVARKRQHARR